MTLNGHPIEVHAPLDDETGALCDPAWWKVASARLWRRGAFIGKIIEKGPQGDGSLWVRALGIATDAAYMPEDEKGES